MISNLHSLLSSKWYIEPSVINGMLPMLQSVLAGTEFKVSEKTEVTIVTKTGKQDVSYYDWRSGKTIYPKATEPYVMVNPIKSAIFKYNQACGPTGTKEHQKVLQDYMNDSNCIGIVLDIDSGGGQVSGTAEFYDFLKSSTKPVITYTDGMLCSAAYYLASATNKIVANPRADVIGSIGTMVSFVDLTGYYEKQGAKVITEYATKSTAKNKSYRDLLSGNSETYIQTELDPITDTFINDVKAGRTNVNEAVFDGSTYRVEQALEMGLIDEITQIEDVIQSLFTTSDKKTLVNNSNSNMKMSNHAKIMGVIGVAALAMTDKGSYFNEENLNAFESALTTAETEKEQLTAELATANQATQTATETIATLQTAAEQATTQATAFVSKIATSLGLEANATEQEIDTRLAEVAKGAGANHVNPQGNEKPKDEAESFIDKDASHNQLANQI